MAQPIPFNLPPRDPKEALYRKLEEAPQEHAEALLAAYDVLQKLHDQGALDILRGGLGSGDKILKMLVDASKTPEAIRGMRNLIILAKLADSFEPEMLEQLAAAVKDGMAHAKTQKPLGRLRLLRKMLNRDSRRALTLMAQTIEAVGKGLRFKRTQ